ncbi:hypothetical protein LEM8419_02759 [Neolewinella maritima]|uniref:Uncharacterized protein n=1 Tax=Neolewinella maritima TaxID=1383882 RepID=A0ABM9B3N9_9BACT|nr:hypothetical protein [Neolewinella maritima]CAH1001851.1 hypothetical protein LEM8419_02759 [Neolewinella maritima]
MHYLIFLALLGLPLLATAQERSSYPPVSEDELKLGHYPLFVPEEQPPAATIPSQTTSEVKPELESGPLLLWCRPYLRYRQQRAMRRQHPTTAEDYLLAIQQAVPVVY